MLQPVKMFRVGFGAGGGLEIWVVLEVARVPLFAAVNEPGMATFVDVRKAVSGVWFDLNCCCSFADRDL